MHLPRGIPAALCAASLLVGACGGGGSDSDDPPTPASPSGPAGAPLDAGPGPAADAAPPGGIVNGFVEVGRIDLDADGTALYEETRVVDADGDRVLARFDENADGIDDAEATFDYDGSGNLVRATFDDGESLAFVETHEHDEDGLLLESVYEESTGRRAVELTAFEYDETGRLLTRSVFDVDRAGPLLSRATYSYGADGLAESGLELAFDRDDFVGTDGVGEPVSMRRESYEHDGSGRLTALRFDANDDGLVDGSVEYGYDANGNVTRLERLDADGEVTRAEEYRYEPAPEPIYNRWLRTFRFFL